MKKRLPWTPNNLIHHTKMPYRWKEILYNAFMLWVHFVLTVQEGVIPPRLPQECLNHSKIGKRLIQPFGLNGLVYLKITQGKSLSYCHGILLSKDKVLSLANCFGTTQNPVHANEVKVHYPDTHLVYGKTIVRHEYYDSRMPYTNNMAIVVLTQAIDMALATPLLFPWAGTENKNCHLLAFHDENYVEILHFHAYRGYPPCKCSYNWEEEQKNICGFLMDSLATAVQNTEWLGAPIVCHDKVTSLLHYAVEPNTCSRLQWSRGVPPNYLQLTAPSLPYYSGWISHIVGIPEDKGVFNNSVNHEIVYMSVLYEEYTPNTTYCHGVMISINRILSVASCFVYSNGSSVLPENVMMEYPPIAKGTIMRHILIHPSFNHAHILEANIAILATGQRIERDHFFANIAPIGTKGWPEVEYERCTLVHYEKNEGSLIANLFIASTKPPLCACLFGISEMGRSVICGGPGDLSYTKTGKDWKGAALICDGTTVGLLVALVDRTHCEIIELGYENETDPDQHMFTYVPHYYKWIKSSIEEPITRAESACAKYSLCLIIVAVIVVALLPHILNYFMTPQYSKSLQIR